MANELDLYDSLSAGEIAPYNEGMPVAPLSPDTWGNNDLLREDQHQPPALTFFGEACLPGVTEAHVQQTLDAFGQQFEAEFSSLGYPVAMTRFAIKFFKEHALKPPRQVRANHNFELPSELSGDWLANAFCNRLEGLAGTIPQKTQFMNAALKWLAKQAKHNSQVVVSQQPRMAPLNVEDQLTDQQYNVLVKHNENVKTQTMGRLEQRWGQCFRQNLALAQAHLNKMTTVEIAHFDRYTGSWPWTHFLNSYEGLVGLFEMAIGVNSMPTNGPAIAQEILQIEALMREPATRRAYLKDDALQARYRQLLSFTLGGR